MHPFCVSSSWLGIVLCITIICAICFLRFMFVFLLVYTRLFFCIYLYGCLSEKISWISWNIYIPSTARASCVLGFFLFAALNPDFPSWSYRGNIGLSACKLVLWSHTFAYPLTQVYSDQILLRAFCSLIKLSL